MSEIFEINNSDIKTMPDATFFLDRKAPFTAEQRAAELARKKANRRRDVILNQKAGALTKADAIAAMRANR